MTFFWQPTAVLMENVPGMLSVKGTDVAEEVAAGIAQGGYRVGAAQNVKIGYLFLSIWGVMGLITIAAAVVALSSS